MVGMYNFHDYDHGQCFLLPQDLRKWLPPDHLAWLVLDAVAQFDLAPFFKGYRADGWGAKAFHPAMMVGLFVYSYCVGERSSRMIERRCYDDVAFRVVTANKQPDHATISRFRKRHEEALSGLFIEVLRLCAEAGLVKVGTVSVDGTKIKANASLDANRTREALKKEIQEFLKEADEADAAEDRKYGADRRGDELPEPLREPKGRFEELKAAKRRMDAEAEAAKAARREWLAAREEQERATGQKKRGPKPKKTPSDAVKVNAKVNMTDRDSRIMKTRSGYVQGYNAQAAVTKEQMVIAAELTRECNDTQQLGPMTQKAEENVAKIGIKRRIGAILADAGYGTKENLAADEAARKDDPGRPELFAKTKDWKKRRRAQLEKPPSEAEAEAPPPTDASVVERMAHKLGTAKGREIYRLRGITVEPVFGQIKAGRGIDRFMRRGFDACKNEWKLICAAHNLLKLWRSGLAKTSAT